MSCDGIECDNADVTGIAMKSPACVTNRPLYIRVLLRIGRIRRYDGFDGAAVRDGGHGLESDSADCYLTRAEIDGRD